MKFNTDVFLGEQSKFSLEERIFNAFCSIAVVALFLEIFFNWYIGLQAVAIICFFGAAISGFLYYLSRFKRATKLAIRSMGVLANSIFVFNYFFNSGIYGPNLLLFALVLLITIVIVPKNELWIWIAINLLCVSALMLYEYFTPGGITNVYRSDLVKTVDFAVTYVVAAWLICLTISFIRNNYDKERAIVSQKNVEIEEQTFQILRQNQDLERLNSEKAKLFSIVAHDIRSPLSSILGYLEVLAKADVTEEENSIITKKLLRVTKDTSDMVSNVLAWSKSQMNGANVNITSVNVFEALDKGLELERSIADKKKIELSLKLANYDYVAADLNMFIIVARNLVNNAIKFTPSGGSVTITGDIQGNEYLLKVIDTGLGVIVANRSALFELKALSTFGTNNEKGVGLGLMLCKDFVALQGGRIWYEPNSAGGSTFIAAYKSFTSN